MLETERRKETLACLNLAEENINKLNEWMKEKDIIRAIEELKIDLKDIERAIDEAWRNLTSIKVYIEPILRKTDQKELIKRKIKKLEKNLKKLKGMYFLTPAKVSSYKEAVEKLKKEFDEFKVNLRKII